MPAGLGYGFGFGGGPQGGLLGGLGRNRNMLLGMASGLMGPGYFEDGMSRGFQNAMSGSRYDHLAQMDQHDMQRQMQQDQIEAEERQRKLAREQQLMSLAGQHAPESLQPFVGADPELAGQFFESIIDAQTGGGTGDYGTTVHWGEADGTIRPFQVDSLGRARLTDLPEGFTPLAPGDIAEQRARGTAFGKGRGEQLATAEADMAKAEQMLSLIRDIKADPALESSVGWGRLTSMGGITRQLGLPGEVGDFDAKVAQLQGQTFLQAYQDLKGGGHITEIEGTKAENAIARLQNAQTAKAFMDALTELEQVVLIGVMRTRRRVGVPSSAPFSERVAPSLGGTPPAASDDGIQDWQTYFGAQ